MNDEKNKLVEIDSKYYETEKQSDQDLEVAKINLTNEQKKVDTLLSSLSAGKVIEHKNSLEEMRTILNDTVECIDKNQLQQARENLNNINIAKLHAQKNKLKIKYLCLSPEKLKTSEKFDVILNMEIIEHVENVSFFLKSCAKHLRKNGVMFVATLNKTLKSYVFAIVGAEYILRWLPIGTHEWEKFLKPEELIFILKRNNLKIDRVDGMQFNILTDKWKVSEDKSVNYIAKFIKS